ncbi:MAG: NFACT RNA binding domain-containing protein [Chloroflexi bacterium]|nr:NFACT RNA binding domain-containing protein [Chloroflexota bacterium]
MNFDVLTLAAVRREIEERAVGGRIQRVVSPEPNQIGLEIYAKRRANHLLIQAGPVSSRVHFVRGRLHAGKAPASPLLLLLRKWVRGGRLVAATQLPLERVLELHVRARPDPNGPVSEHRLIVEIIGRQANVMLVDDQGLIRDALRRVPGDGARRRIMPRAPYEPPARLSLPAPSVASPADVSARTAPGVPAWRALLQAVAGVSPTLAREALARANVDPTTPSLDVAAWPDVLGALRKIVADLDAGATQPCLVPIDGGWQAFAAYPLTHLDRRCQPAGSMSEALETFYEADEPAASVDTVKSRVVEPLDAAIARVERRIASLRTAAPTGAEISAARAAGSALLEHAHLIPPGTAHFEVNGRQLELDPAKSVGVNAQTYFARYRDLKRAARLVPRRLRRAELELAYLRQAADDLRRSDSPAVSRQIEALLAEAGHLRRPRRRRRDQPAAPRERRIRGHRVLAGRTADENHRLTFKESAPDDLWFHARNMPGAHVLLRDPGDDPAPELVHAVARLAAHLSAGHAATAVDVDVTRRRHVRAIRRAGPGQVTYRRHRTLRVAPLADDG